MLILGIERDYTPLKQAAQELQISQEDLIHLGACGNAQICVDVYNDTSGQSRTRVDDGYDSSKTLDGQKSVVDSELITYDPWKTRANEMPPGFYELPMDVLRMFESPDTVSVELYEAYKKDDIDWWCIEFYKPPKIRLHNLYLLKSEMQRLRNSPAADLTAIKQPLRTKERDTLLVIIAALAIEAEIDLSKPSKAASLIEGLTAQMGSPVSKRGIEEHLKNVAGALASRSK